MQCWKMSPEDRPTFKEICSSVSKFIERVAGYLEIGFNPFTGGGAEKGGEGGEEQGEEQEEGAEDEKVERAEDESTVAINVIPPSV